MTYRGQQSPLSIYRPAADRRRAWRHSDPHAQYCQPDMMYNADKALTTADRALASYYRLEQLEDSDAGWADVPRANSWGCSSADVRPAGVDDEQMVPVVCYLTPV